jgi:hypothetical protein
LRCAVVQRQQIEQIGSDGFGAGGELYERAIAATGLPLERPAMTILVILHLPGHPSKSKDWHRRAN